MASDRWDPFREAVSLRDAMNTLLQDSFVRPLGNIASGLQNAGLPLDVVEREDAFIIWASLPGAKPEDVEITMQGDTLLIRCEAPVEPAASEGQTWLLRERRKGPINRSLSLTSPVDADAAKAKFEDGVLTLTLPKSGLARPKQIRIGAGTEPAPAGLG